MDDIIEKLKRIKGWHQTLRPDDVSTRASLHYSFVTHPTALEAANEIERLNAEIARLREAIEEYVNTVVKMEGVTFLDQMENTELRAVVESILAEKEEK